MEKSTLIIGAIFVYIGSKKWMANYRKISLTDELTRLSNRAHTKELINKEIIRAKENNSVFCLVIIDIDLFKCINDEYGHYFGDMVLAKFSDLLNHEKRTEDVLGRWGGEEFVMVLKNINKPEAFDIAKYLKLKIEDHVFNIEGKEIHLTASFGISEYEESMRDFKKLFTQADIAMYKAKNSGRNKVM